MKILNYSTLSLLFSTILQAISGYTCPNTAEINKKIVEKQPMRFPLVEGEKVFWRQKDSNHLINKYYVGKGNMKEIAGIFYKAPLVVSNDETSALMCIYKNNQSTYFALSAAKKMLKEINSSSITENSNWKKFDPDGFYSCGDNDKPKESIDDCQFSLKVYH